MNFSTNQNRQFYLVKNVVSGTFTNVGDIQLKTIDNGCDKELYFVYKGADTMLRSDRIPVKNISYVKAVDASSMITPLKKVTVALDSTVSAALIAGQDYLLRIVCRQFYGMSDQDVYIKDAVVHCTSAMVSTPALFWTAMKNALDASFSRELGATKTSNPYFTFTNKSTSLEIQEKEQDWERGIRVKESIYFDVFPTTIYVGGTDAVWGTTEATYGTTVGTNAVGNGTKIADLEWFCLGERGDIYRNIGWPNTVPTEYLVDPTTQYHTLEIHYAFTDTGVNSYRSEKDITIAVPIGTSDAGQTTINALITAINSATGLSIATLGTTESEEETSGTT